MSTRTRTTRTQPARQSLHQRGANATRDLREALRLPTNPNDTTVLGTALAEAAAREIWQNPRFAEDIRQRYEELLRLRGGASKPTLEPLVVLRHTGTTPDPYAPPNPKTLMYVYGDDKLGRALQEYTLDMLKQTADRIQAAHPGTKPKNRSSKQSVIDYIVKYSGGQSALHG